MRFFNTAGPVDGQRHYCLPPLERLDLTHVLRLIDQQKYFVLHAPRQTGKTSVLLALMDHLNARRQHRCIYVNVEVGQAAREAVAEAMRAILSELAFWAGTVLNDSFVDDIWAEVLAKSGSHSALGQVLSRWSARDPQPLVLLIDEMVVVFDEIHQLRDPARVLKIGANALFATRRGRDPAMVGYGAR